MNRIYVAASSAEIDRAREAMKWLRLAGFEVVSTWVETVEKVGEANPAHASEEQRCQWSNEDLNQVESSDVFWLLAPRLPTRGAWVELGYAYAHDRPIVISGDTKQSIFCAVGDEFIYDLGAFMHIVAKRDEWRLIEAEAKRRVPRPAAEAR